MFLHFLALFFENSRTAPPCTREAAVTSARIFDEYDIIAINKITNNSIRKTSIRNQNPIFYDKFEIFPRKHQKFMENMSIEISNTGRKLHNHTRPETRNTFANTTHTRNLTHNSVSRDNHVSTSYRGTFLSQKGNNTFSKCDIISKQITQIESTIQDINSQKVKQFENKM